jgi:crotonobetainyl-CoA:carnitine CoA-transferase CaiB-like acyl-CoA transferase
MVDTSIVNGGVHLNTDAWIGPDGWSPRPRSDRAQSGLGPLYRLYRTMGDGWIALACLGESHWTRLTKVVAGLEGDARFADGAQRAEHAGALTDVLAGFFAERSAGDAFAALDAAAVPVEIADPAASRAWFDRPDLVAAGLVADYRHPQYGRFRQFGTLVHLSDTPGRIAGPPPMLGEHSREVLAGLGYTGAEIDELRAKGVTTWPR